MSLLHKLVLGTVQFGLDYGINNHSGQVSKREVANILKLASLNGLNVLDTSSAYGNSEIVLGEALQECSAEFKIISKYPRSPRSVESVLYQTLSELKQTSIYGYLVHHFDFYCSDPSIFDEMLRLKEKGLIEKVGFSIYSPDQLQYLLNKQVDIDLIQFPYNIFDRQFEPYFSMLKERQIEIHTRSVFLQGLFFADINSFKDKLSPLVKYIRDLHQYCNENNITVGQLVLNYVVSNPYIDGILIGVDNSTQLDANIVALNKGIRQQDIEFIEKMNVKEMALLNPANW